MERGIWKLQEDSQRQLSLERYGSGQIPIRAEKNAYSIEKQCRLLGLRFLKALSVSKHDTILKFSQEYYLLKIIKPRESLVKQIVGTIIE